MAPVWASDELRDPPISFRFISALWELYEGIEDLKPMDPTYGTLAKQPDTLANRFDTDRQEHFYQWFRKCDERREIYKKYLEEANRQKKHLEELAKAGATPTPAEMEKYNQALVDLESIQQRFMGAQGYHWTCTNEHELEVLIYTSPFKKRSDFKASKKLPAYNTEYPSKALRENRVKGFIVAPEELKIYYRMLQRLNEKLDRELFALQKIHLSYERNLKPEVRGWTPEQLANWWNISTTTIPVLQKAIDQEVREKFDPTFPLLPTHSKWPRDLSTDRGSVLAKLNADPRGLRLRNIKGKIVRERNYDGNTDPNEESTFEAIYHHLNIKNEPKFFEVFKDVPYQRKNKVNELYRAPAVIFRTYLNPRKMIALAKPFELLKVWDKEKNDWIIKEPEPEAKLLPAGMFMVTDEFRCFTNMSFHRSIYRPVREELKEVFEEGQKALKSRYAKIGRKDIPEVLQKARTAPSAAEIDRKNMPEVLARTRAVPHNSAIIDQWRYDDKLLKDYNVAYDQYLEKLKALLQLHLVIHKQPTYFGITSYIPTAWKFSLWEPTYPLQTFTPSLKLDLSKSDLMDIYFNVSQKPMSQCVFAMYQIVKMSDNDMLDGSMSFGYSGSVTSLTLDHCNLKSLACINGLVKLRELDVSYNYLEDFNCDQVGRLTKLTAPHNILTGLRSLGIAVSLRELNLSTNLLTSMKDLYLVRLEKLDVSHNPNLTLGNLSPHATTLSKLNVKGCDMRNEDTGSFKMKYTTLRSLTLEHNETFTWDDFNKIEKVPAG